MKVTVITPFYKGNEYLPGYQAMLLKNEARLKFGDEMEVILVNDSPEEAVQLAGTLLIQKNWKVIKNKKNMGIHASRVEGLKEASGEYIIFLDQDDLLAENALALFLEKARDMAKEEGTTVCTSVLVANANLERREETNLWYRTPFHSGKVGDLRTYLTVGPMIVSPGQCMIPRDKIPAFWKRHIVTKNGSDDYFLWLLLLKEGVPFTYIDLPLYTHKFTEKNLSEDTSATDESCYEFIGYLEHKEDFSQKELNTLKRMLSFKAAFRKGTGSQKLKQIMLNPGLFAANFYFKAKSHTGYGFNRG